MGGVLMYRRDYRDIWCGMLLILVGTGAAYHSSTSYELGTVRQMGPGMYPLVLGLILVGLGALLFVPAMFRAGPSIQVSEWRPLVAITAAGTIFGLTIERFGIIPAVIVLTLISVLAGDKLRPIPALLLAIALAVCSMLIFQVGLKLPVKAFGWPF
jgi:putative tricarboxylic transport membrane protein